MGKEKADKQKAHKGKTDEDVLQEIDAHNMTASAMTQIKNYQWEREEANRKKYEELMAVAGDVSKTPEQSAKAAENLRALEEKEARIHQVEETLAQQYQGATLQEEDSTYKVFVVNKSLNTKQAVSIADLVMKELQVPQHKISIQHVKDQ